jgi:trimeric autotransporter adhesin
VAVGAQALFSNTTGDANTATGDNALSNNTTGEQNTASGDSALAVNTTGSDNTANGAQALFLNTTDFQNTAIGFSALVNNSTGSANAAIGAGALALNNAGNNNTAVGINALNSNTAGSNNVAIGGLAGVEQTTGNDNIYIGFNARGVAGESDACYIASIFNQTSATGTPVFINSNNKLGTSTSSKRFKEDIKPMDNGSEALFSLKSVRFRYKQEIDPNGTPQFGLVAEEVEKVNPDLVVRDKEGKPYSVRYEQVNRMLVNEFLKEHRKNEEQEKTIVELKSGMTALAATVKEQAAQIQKVSTQPEASKPAPQVVNNNQ